MIRVEYGPFDRLERAFLRRLRELKSRDPLAPVAVVAPSRRMADRLERLVAVENGLSLLGVHFHTFHSLALEVLDASGFPEGTFIGDPLFHDRLVDALLEARPALGRRFGGAARPKALASALRASMRDLIDAGVRPGELLENLGDWPQSAAAARRLADLLELQRAYEDLSAELGVVSAAGVTRAAAAAAEKSEFLSRFREILYYGFYDLTGLQLDFFDRVTANRPSRVYFPYRKGHPAWRFCDDFFDLKLHRGGEAARSLEGRGQGARPLPRSPANSAAGGGGGDPPDRDTRLSAVAEALFSPGREVRPSAAAGGAGLRLFNASGARDEVWRVSKEILRLVEEEGFAFDDVGVVARTLEPYRAAIADLFDADAVPFESADGEPLQRHPAAATALELLTLRRRDFPADSLTDLVQSPYFRPPGAAPRSARGWGRLLERLGVSAGWLAWEAKLEHAARAGSPEASGLLSWLRSIREALDPAGGPRSWKEWSGRARRLLEAHLALPADAAPVESEAWGAVGEALEELAAFEPLGAVEWNFCLETFAEKLAGARLPAPSRRGVRVLNAMDARGESFRVLFLLGLQEGLFPRQVREDPLLPDEARERLKHPGGYWIARKGAGHEEERLLFALCVSAARERLYCGWCRSDADGRALTPSWYLRELCRAAGLELSAAERVPRRPMARLASVPPELLSPQEAALRLTDAGQDAGGLLAAAGREYDLSRGSRRTGPPGAAGAAGELAEGLRERVGRLNSRGDAGRVDGMVGPDRETLAGLLRRGFSPSALDAFARCPFQYFAAYILELEDEEDLARRGELSSSLRGNIHHAALERFYRSLLRSGYWDTPSGDWEGPLAEAVRATFEEHGWRDLGVYPLVWKATRSAMETELRRFIRWDMERIRATGLVPSLFEAELRGPLPLPAVRGMPADAPAVEFHGFADRVDIDRGGARYQVVDYKTRWRRERLERLVYSGRMHQPPVYAELAPRAIRPEGDPPVAGAGEKAAPAAWRLEGVSIYAIETSENERRLHEYPAEAWRKDRPEVLAAVAAYLSEIARGRFPIRPDDGRFGHCGWCAFSAMCRKSHGRSRERAEAAYAGSTLEKIHERKRPKAA